MKRRPSQLLYIDIYIGAFVKRYREMKELLVQKSKKKNLEKTLKNSRTICEKMARFLKSLFSVSVPNFTAVGRC